MKAQISAWMDKVLTAGMSVMESERAQKIMASPQAQKAMDLGIAALTKLQEASEGAKACLAEKLGLATQKEVDALRDQISQLEAKAEKADTAEPATSEPAAQE